MRTRWLFSYVVDHDEGYSPNPVGGICTLAHCKFSESGRRNLVEMAEIGDWIVGTGGKSAYSAGHGRLIYAMRVTDKIPLRTYLTVRQYVNMRVAPIDSRRQAAIRIGSLSFPTTFTTSAATQSPSREYRLVI